MIFNKDVKTIQWGRTTNGGNWILTCRRMKLETLSYTIYKINSKWIKDLNVRAKNIKSLKENIGGKLHDIGFGDRLLDMTPKAQKTKEKLN